MIEESKDPLSDWLDKQCGHTVADNDIFIKLPRYWEAEYHKDMDALNVSKTFFLCMILCIWRMQTICPYVDVYKTEEVRFCFFL